MTFAFPILLGGLAFAALPVLLHFLIRRKPKTLPFPAFQFLMQKRRSNTNNLRLRHLLLLLLRIALIALLCLALSRPRLFTEDLGITREKPVAMVLVFDTSPSMEYKVGETSRFDLAKKRALELLEPLAEDSRVLVLDTSEAGTFAKEKFLPSLTKARQRIQGLTVKPCGGSVNRAIAEGMNRLKTWDEPAAQSFPQFVCVFGDRTKTSWDPSITLQRHDQVQTLFFDVGVDDPVDIAITHVEFASGRQSFTEGESIELRAIVKATGKNVENALTFKLAGKEIEHAFTLAKDEQQTVTANLHAEDWKLAPGFHQLEVSFKTAQDALSFNNRRFATLEVQSKPRVLVLTDEARNVAQLTTALTALLHAIDTKKPADKVNYADYKAIFLISAAMPDDKVWLALADYVEKGGGLAVIPGGTEMKLRAYRSEAARKVLPTQFVNVVEASKGVAWDLDGNDFQHPFMRPFHGWHGMTNIDFLQHERRATKYWDTEPIPVEKDREIVVRYQDDKRRPAIVERRIPKSLGKVLVLTTPLDDRAPAWNNYSENVTSFYLTLTWLTARHLVAESGRASFNHVFGQAMPKVPSSASLSRAELKGPGISEEIHFDKANLWQPERLPRQGNYTVIASNPDTKQAAQIAAFSVNCPGEESDLMRMPIEYVEAALGKDSVIALDQRTPLIDTMASRWEEPTELFPFLMILLLVLFALENLIANKFYRREPEAV